MQSSILSRRFAAAAALALAALAATSTAQARGDVTFSIGIQVPGVHAYPAPVYVQPAPVFVQPRPIYMQPAPVFIQPRPVFVQPRAYGNYYGKRHGWHRGKWQRADKHWRGGHHDNHGDRQNNRGGHQDNRGDRRN